MSEIIDEILKESRKRAKEQKQRLKKRMRDLTNINLENSRGPLLKNGRVCVRFHFYKKAKKKHEKLSAEAKFLHSRLKRS